MKTLNVNLAKIIKDRNLSYREVSLGAGKSEQFVRNIVNGMVESPSIDAIQAIAKQLNVTVGYLLGEQPALQFDPEILSACMLWVLDNYDQLGHLSKERIVQELTRQYGYMLNERINDKREAVRITRYLFDNLQHSKASSHPRTTTEPAVSVKSSKSVKPAPKTPKAKAEKPKTAPRRSAK